ncbi:hypothetical protein [Arthrobacter sp. 2MCAF14]|uniref:hypothetical protein n=1 Tax=Arthrobacter sp. 2MCAF14 TaxID=3232982 RepID=UPI003F9268A5
MNPRRYGSKVAVASAVAVLLLWSSAPAEAAFLAGASAAPQAVGSGTWGAVATLNPAAPYGAGPLNLTFANSGSDASPVYPIVYFNTANTGTLPITQAGYTGAASAPSNVQFTIESCSTTWDEAGNLCTGGTVSQVLTVAGGSSGSAASGTVPASPGAAIRLRARALTAGSIPAGTPYLALAVGVSVDRTQVRAATVTNG